MNWRFRESEWTPGVGDGQGGLACCDWWGRKESDTTERLNWTELKHIFISITLKWGLNFRLAGVEPFISGYVYSWKSRLMAGILGLWFGILGKDGGEASKLSVPIPLLWWLQEMLALSYCPIMRSLLFSHMLTFCLLNSFQVILFYLDNIVQI